MNAKAAFVLLLLCLSQAGAAEEAAFACPAALPSAPTAAWTVHNKATLGASGKPSEAHSLTGMTLFAGPPSDDASLVPDTDRRVGHGMRESTWPLSGEHWVGCLYRGTPAMLVQRVPDGLSRCRMRYRAGKSATTVVEFVCSKSAT